MSKRILIQSVIMLLVLCLISGPTLAAGPSGGAGKSPTGHLYLFEKDPETWEVIEDSAWGMLRYTLWGSKFRFVFVAKDLEPMFEYTLVYYPDPWPGEGLICLGSSRSNWGGNININGMRGVDTGDLPSEFDENFDYGAKLWLVLSSDVDCEEQKMVFWDPEEYLFEYNLIYYNDTSD